MPGQIAGQIVDFGGQWIGPQQHRIRSEADRYGVALYPQYLKGKRLISLGGKVQAYKSNLPKLSWPALLETALIAMIWDKNRKKPPEGAPWKAAKALEWDALSMEAWLNRHVRLAETRKFLRTIITAIMCTNPAHVSYLYFLEVLHQGKGLDIMLADEGGSQQDKLRGGAWLIFKRMADHLGDNIILSSPVRSIVQHENSVDVITDHAKFSAKRVIVTAPPQIAAQIDYNPALPVKKSGILRRMPMGAVIKMHIAYPTPFWRKRGLNGSALGIDLALSVVYDQSPEDERIGILVGLIEGQHAIEMSRMTQDQRRKEIIADLVRYFGEDAAEPIEYVDYDWTADVWAQGGYGANMPPGVATSYGEALREPVGRIHWAGTETAIEWLGYFEGALQSGTRVADEISILED